MFKLCRRVRLYKHKGDTTAKCSILSYGKTQSQQKSLQAKGVEHGRIRAHCIAKRPSDSPCGVYRLATESIFDDLISNFVLTLQVDAMYAGLFMSHFFKLIEAEWYTIAMIAT